MESALVFVHLSDIHLSRSEIESGTELDEDLRREVQRDVTKVIDGRCDGILISGDIAFAGEDLEYDSARDWLESLCGVVGCPPDAVWMVPGNHDVHWPVIQSSKLLKTVHDRVRSAPDNNWDNELRGHLADEQAAELLLAPLASFNEFAAGYGCETVPRRIRWEHDFRLNDDSTLRVTGLNSALISSWSDDDRSNKLVVGINQVQLTREEGVVYLTVCHHPRDWLFDADSLEDHLDSRAAVQLYGHKHRQRVKKVGNSLVMSSGALHPKRDEPSWDPRYNVLKIWVEAAADERRLCVAVHERQWNSAQTAFAPATGSPKEFELKLNAWSGECGLQGGGAPVTDDGHSSDLYNESSMAPREVLYRLYSLPYPQRMKVLSELDLLEPGDQHLEEAERVRMALLRARERETIDDLLQRIESMIVD